MLLCIRHVVEINTDTADHGIVCILLAVGGGPAQAATPALTPAQEPTPALMTAQEPTPALMSAQEPTPALTPALAV